MTYYTLKISDESRRVIDEVMTDAVYSRINVKDIIAAAWPRCPKCGSPLVQKFASQHLICVRCRTTYALSHA